MDNYLSDRVDRPKSRIKPKRKKEKVEYVDEDSEEFTETRIPFYQRIIKYFYTGKKGEIIEEEVDIGVKDEVVEEMDKEFEEFEEEEIVATQKKGFFDKLFSFFLPEVNENIDEDEYVEAHIEEEKKGGVPKDLKEALKIQNKWLKRLSSDDIADFKASEDYYNYKQILKKYGLIKS